MEKFFKLKRALVTGAGKGFGRAITCRLTQLGAEVVAISRTQSDLDSLKHEIPSVKTVLLDVGDWDKTRFTVEKLGPIQMLVNNAGVSTPGLLIDMPKEKLDRDFNINFKAAYNITQVVARGMVERQEGGSIVMMSSALSKTPIPYGSVYSPSKAAIDMLTMVLAKELGPHKIRTNAVNPGFALTNFTQEYLGLPGRYEAHLAEIPLGRFTEVRDVVDAVVFLLSDQAAMINGIRLNVDGGAYLP